MISLESNISAVLRKTRATLGQQQIRGITKAAINDTIAKSKTSATKEMRAEGYMLSATKIKARLAIKSATSAILVGSLRAMGRRVNLIEYSARQVGKSFLVRNASGQLAMKEGGGVSVLVKRSRKVIKHAFIKGNKVYIRASYLRSKRSIFLSGGIDFSNGFAIREEEIKQLTGPGVPTMLANEVVMRVLGRDAPKHFSARLAHHLKRASR
jgi:hypothetical protein